MRLNPKLTDAQMQGVFSSQRFTVQSAALGLCAAALCLAQAFRLPSVLAGFGLRLVSDRKMDGHLLTSHAWSLALERCGLSTACIHAWNVGTFAVVACAFVLALLALRTNAILATCSGLVIAISPLAFPLLFDPVGAEASAGLFIFVAALVTVSSAHTIPRFAAACIPALLLLQVPLDALAAVYCAAVLLCRNRVDGVLSLVLLCLAVALRYAAGVGVVDLDRIHGTAGSLTIIALGLLTFVALPVLLYGVKQRWYEYAGLTVQRALPILVIGMLAMVGGLFAAGDPSAQWLAGETAAVGALAYSAYSSKSRLPGGALIAIALLAAVSLATMSLARADLPSARVAVQLQNAANILKPEFSGTICIADSTGMWQRSVGFSTFARTYTPSARITSVASAARCVTPATLPNAMIVVADGNARTWDANGVFLTQAGAAALRTGSQHLAAMRALVAPAPPRGKPAAFQTSVDTPLGSVAAITIVAGHSYRIPCVDLSRKAALTFAAQNPLADYTHAGAVRFTVLASSRVVAARTIEPGKTRWAFYRVELPNGRRCTALTLRVDAPTGNAIGAWASFAAPSVN